MKHRIISEKKIDERVVQMIKEELKMIKNLDYKCCKLLFEKL